MIKRVHFISVLVLFLNNVLFSQINDIKSFLDQCPTTDPVIDTILKDFEIRLNGNLVTEFPCYEPVSSMNVANYSNPLIYLQTLRVIYYMDRENDFSSSTLDRHYIICLDEKQMWME